jgi:hypothetical protein
LQLTGKINITINLIMDISSIILRSSLRTLTRRLETNVGDAEEDRHNQTSQHQRARRYLGITLIGSLIFSGRACDHFSFYITSLLFWAEFSQSTGLPNLISASFVLGWEGDFLRGFFFLVFYIPFPFPFPFYFRFPNGDLHHEINDVCVCERGWEEELGSS